VLDEGEESEENDAGEEEALEHFNPDPDRIIKPWRNELAKARKARYEPSSTAIFDTWLCYCCG